MQLVEVMTCRKCGEEKDLVEFPLRRDGKNGHRRECRTCKNKREYSRRARWIESREDIASRVERVLARTYEDEKRCWIYGRPGVRMTLDLGNRRTSVYRVVYEHLVGPVPAELHLDHLCREPACINPAHLEPVTPRENALRGVHPNVLLHNSGRCRRGHEMTEDNTRIRPRGTRVCRTCERDWKRERYWKQKVTAQVPSE